ncbi:Pol polyprotein, partial [Mucuna pruriens]
MHEMLVDTNNIHVAPSDLHNLTSPWPFAMWGLDMISPIEPKVSNEHRFILVAIDYFTKWVEAVSYASVMKSIVVKFIKRDIICRYGLPAHIITDNGTNLNNKMMSKLWKQFKIKYHNFTPYRPKMNGAVEATNKNIKKIVQKMVVTYKYWHDMLPYALHDIVPQYEPLQGQPPTNWPRWFKGDLVLKKILPNARDSRGKWTPNYEGPYVVKCAFSGGALVLADSEGQELKYPEESKGLALESPSTTYHERKHYQSLAEGIRPKVGPDLPGRGTLQAHLRVQQTLIQHWDKIYANQTLKSQVCPDDMRLSKE